MSRSIRHRYDSFSKRCRNSDTQSLFDRFGRKERKNGKSEKRFEGSKEKKQERYLSVTSRKNCPATTTHVPLVRVKRTRKEGSLAPQKSLWEITTRGMIYAHNTIYLFLRGFTFFFQHYSIGLFGKGHCNADKNEFFSRLYTRTSMHEIARQRMQTCLPPLPLPLPWWTFSRDIIFSNRG